MSDPALCDYEKLSIYPLGAGQEVGRSCIILEFKNKKIMLDCGIHPGRFGLDALPFFDAVDLDQIDLLLISHFHLDHSGSLPYLLEKTIFRGRCFMTHPTKSIYRLLLTDYAKVCFANTDRPLYNVNDIMSSMSKIETIDYHQEMFVDGIKFSCTSAGHVLGAAMFLIEIAGVKIMYTGDFSREEDRHLMAAEIPPIVPDVLIIESTYGTNVHESKDSRENRFTKRIEEIVTRGGRCLIPVFALGRAQELLLILDEFWENNSRLRGIPIYYGSHLARKCIGVFQTFVDFMNDKIRDQMSISNPFMFKHISNIRNIDEFDDMGPSVVLASPGMMQSGLSRDLLEMWCTDPKNGVIIAGYCVEGTLARSILRSPENVQTSQGGFIPLRCSVEYISFSAHTDYKQTSDFIRKIKPAHIVLVHGERTVMGRLKAALIREYEDDPSYDIDIYDPRNTERVELNFKGERTAKIIGNMATRRFKDGDVLSGVIVKRNFNYHVMDPSEVADYTKLIRSSIVQRQTIPFKGSKASVKALLRQLTDSVEERDERVVIAKSIEITFNSDHIIMEWTSSPSADLYADAIQSMILKDDLSFELSDDPNIKLYLVKSLEDMFGTECVDSREDSNVIVINVDDAKAYVDVVTRVVTSEDEAFYSVVSECVQRAISPLLPL